MSNTYISYETLLRVSLNTIYFLRALYYMFILKQQENTYLSKDAFFPILGTDYKPTRYTI